MCATDCAFSRAQDASAQHLAGAVHSAAGAPASGAHVELKSGAGTLTAVSAADGSFLFSIIPPGSYSLSLEESKHRFTLPQPITFPRNAATLAVTLPDPATGSDALSAAFLPLAPARTDQPATSGGEDLSSHAVSSLPLNKRDFSQLLLLAAGTMTDANGATNFTQQFAINGQRGVEATFAMDGADTSDPEMGGADFSNFNVDAVEEIRSSSGWMPAEIGRGAAGFTNIHTRSGASGFHGSFLDRKSVV